MAIKLNQVEPVSLLKKEMDFSFKKDTTRHNIKLQKLKVRDSNRPILQTISNFLTANLNKAGYLSIITFVILPELLVSMEFTC